MRRQPLDRLLKTWGRSGLRLPRWPLQHLAERYYRSELAGQNRQTLDLYVANLLGTLHRYEVLSLLASLSAQLGLERGFAPLDAMPMMLANLEVAWTFRTGEMALVDSENQNTPIQVGDTLFICTPLNKVFA